jgi:hypothetical protein
MLSSKPTRTHDAPSPTHSDETRGVQDTFAESGPYLEVIDKYGLTARHIVKAVRDVLKRKPKLRVDGKSKVRVKPKSATPKPKATPRKKR